MIIRLDNTGTGKPTETVGELRALLDSFRDGCPILPPIQVYYDHSVEKNDSLEIIVGSGEEVIEMRICGRCLNGFRVNWDCVKDRKKCGVFKHTKETYLGGK